MNTKKPYDKNDNDTYVEKYSSDMILDVEIHMFKSDKGSSVSGGVLGNFSEESRQTARNNVLHFPTASDLGLKLLKETKLKSILPYSLMKRYDIELWNVEYTQKTPVFFDVSEEKFVLCMDKRILRDLSELPKFEKSLSSIDSVEVKSTSTDSQILIKYDSLSDLVSDKTGAYSAVKDKYRAQLLTLSDENNVIITAYNTDEDVRSYFSNSSNGISLIKSADTKKLQLKSVNISFEFFKAKMVGENKFYLYDSDGNLNTSSILNLEKKKYREDQKNSFQSNSNIPMFFGDSKAYNISKYSEEDWDALVALRNSLGNVFNDLNTILSKQKSSSNQLDMSISEIEFNEDTSLKLGFYSNKSIGLKR